FHDYWTNRSKKGLQGPGTKVDDQLDSDRSSGGTVEEAKISAQLGAIISAARDRRKAIEEAFGAHPDQRRVAQNQNAKAPSDMADTLLHRLSILIRQADQTQARGIIQQVFEAAAKGTASEIRQRMNEWSGAYIDFENQL